MLSDTYWPNVDATNVHTLQYVVTDGRTFTDLQTRDMTYRSCPIRTGMSCTIVASSAAHHYTITTTYIADPARDAVLMRTRFRGPPATRSTCASIRSPAAPAAAARQNAGRRTAPRSSAPASRSAPNTNTTTDAVNRDYAVPTYMALSPRHGFGAESVGYAGQRHATA